MAEQKQRREYDATYDPSRVAAFSDGVIAIAITLLTLEVRIPILTDPTNAQVWDAVKQALPQIGALALSYFVIARYWTAHMRLMRDVTKADTRFVALNTTLLFWIVLMPITTSLISAHGSLILPTVIYALNLAMAGYWMTLLWAYLLRRPELHSKQNVEDDLRHNFRVSLVAPVIFSISIPLAFAHPSIAKYFWIFIVITALPRFAGKRRRGDREDNAR